MEIILNILIIVFTFLFMEAAAWFTHKYIMHGFLWVWHKSHHKVHDHTLERNDLFALVFSLPCISLFYYSTYHTNTFYLTSVAIGILAYGISYFIFHDVIVHRRVSITFNTGNGYLKRIMKAHYKHHEVHTKEGGKAFGFLYAPKKLIEKEN